MDGVPQEPQIRPAHEEEAHMKRSMQFELAVVLLLVSGAASAQEFGRWSPPVNLGPTVNSVSDDMHPTLSKHGLSLILSSAPHA